jgi:hypothetical protein
MLKTALHARQTTSAFAEVVFVCHKRIGVMYSF